MKKNNQKQSENLNLSDKWEKLLVSYIDSITRGLISFFISFILVYFILMGIFHLSFIWILPIIFLLSFALSPLLSKIKLGDKFVVWYIEKLKKFIK